MSIKRKSAMIVGVGELIKENLNTVKEYTKKDLLKLLREGVTYFYVGMDSEFEVMAADMLLKLRGLLSHIKMFVVFQRDFETDAENRTPKDKQRLRAVMEITDDIYYVKDYYKNASLNMRNRFMVGNCAYYLFYYPKLKGVAKNTLEYTDKKDLRIVDISEKIIFNKEK